VLDESHQTVPQIGAMYRGDRARKTNLVEHGFRLPSALDNRPLMFAEWEKFLKQGIFVSATPGNYELDLTEGAVVEQIIRPTGLLDPEIEVRPIKLQVDDLLGEIRQRTANGTRTLVTTLTKRMAEDLSEYYLELGIRVRYLHSDIDTIERIEILRDLRKGEFDVLVGINLLREGLDLPEVSLVAILDADKEGFLRSTRSLIQTIGRAARNAQGKVIMYADKVTKSMRHAIEETARRRQVQEEYNLKHNIVPQTVKRAIVEMTLGDEYPSQQQAGADRAQSKSIEDQVTALRKQGLSAEQVLDELHLLMNAAAENLEFEHAAALRDRIKSLEKA